MIGGTVHLSPEQIEKLKALCDTHGIKRLSEVGELTETSLLRALAGLEIKRGTVSTLTLHLLIHPTFEEAEQAFIARKAAP